jgi:hypothetical protein
VDKPVLTPHAFSCLLLVTIKIVLYAGAKLRKGASGCKMARNHLLPARLVMNRTAGSKNIERTQIAKFVLPCTWISAPGL